jgi:hypothetical protein
MKDFSLNFNFVLFAIFVQNIGFYFGCGVAALGPSW